MFVLSPDRDTVAMEIVGPTTDCIASIDNLAVLGSTKIKEIGAKSQLH